MCVVATQFLPLAFVRPSSELRFEAFDDSTLIVKINDDLPLGTQRAEVTQFIKQNFSFAPTPRFSGVPQDVLFVKLRGDPGIYGSVHLSFTFDKDKQLSSIRVVKHGVQ